jgi:hypothetical protein
MDRTRLALKLCRMGRLYFWRIESVAGAYVASGPMMPSKLEAWEAGQVYLAALSGQRSLLDSLIPATPGTVQGRLF